MFVRAVSLSLVIVLLLLSDIPAQGFGAAAGEHEPLEKDHEAALDSSSSYYLPFDSGRKFSVQMKKGFRARMNPMPRGTGTKSTHTSYSVAPLSRSPVFRVASSLILLGVLFLV